MAKQLSWKQRFERALHVIRKYKSGKLALTTIQEGAMWREYRDVLEHCPHETLYEAEGTEYVSEPLGPDIPHDYHFIFCGLCHQMLEDFQGRKYLGYDPKKLGKGSSDDVFLVTRKGDQWIRSERYHLEPDWKASFYGEPSPYIPFEEYWRKKYPPRKREPSAQDVFEQELAEHL